jgi:threonine synthase
MQKLQMTTQEGENVCVCAINGNFDDAQSGVKKIFTDKAVAEKLGENGMMFSSANSINWGRLVPQIVYYISAYCDLIENGTIKNGDPINVVVPTGNFGNILAAYIARDMGLPIARLICASNSNNVLTDFINTGVYDRTREFYKTISPSMDILISSNLERLIFMMGGAELTAKLMAELKECGKYTAPECLMEKIRGVFSGYCMGEEETTAEIRATFVSEGYLIDPHTAVGLGCVKKYRSESGDNTPVVLASTASPYKFTPAVMEALDLSADSDDIFALMDALSAKSGTEIPAPLAGAAGLPIRFTDVITPDEMPAVPFRV